MHKPVHHDHPVRNLTPAEEIELNDIYHEVGCGCPECRPDMHDPREPAGLDADATEAA